MSMFIYHTLTMLEDAGMSIKYPTISHIELDKDGRASMTYSSYIPSGGRVSVEQNQELKFLMLFTLLDFFVDASYPKLEGKSYREKYKNLPAEGDYNLILRQLFRVAKVIRNALVHNRSSFVISENSVSLDYRRDKHHFCLNISNCAFDILLSAIVMYVRGDMGKGCYFLGIMRSMYEIIHGDIKKFNDEFGSTIDQPTPGIKMKWSHRQVVLHPPYETCANTLRFPRAALQIVECDGMDLYIVRSEEKFLVPREALDEDLSITERNLKTDWKYEGSFPPVKGA